MGRLIKTFADKSYIEYAQGSFDNWCVYFINKNGYRKAPRDTEYFIELKDLSVKYGATRIYDDFCKVYNWTTETLSTETLESITKLSKEYKEDALKIDKLLSILYVSMISEEQKENTKLGKRIKRLGMHVLLIENQSVEYAANFMRGKNWREIDFDCTIRGF